MWAVYAHSAACRVWIPHMAFQPLEEPCGPFAGGDEEHRQRSQGRKRSPGEPLAPGSDLLKQLGRVKPLWKQAEPHRQKNGDKRIRRIHSPVPILLSNPGSWAFWRGLTWTAAACCRFREASLLAVECSKTMFRRGALALVPAERLVRCPGDFGGSRAASEKRQQAAAVQGRPNWRHE